MIRPKTIIHEDVSLEVNLVNSKPAKIIDLSHETDLNFWNCLDDKTYLEEKIYRIAKLHTTDVHIWATLQ